MCLFTQKIHNDIFKFTCKTHVVISSEVDMTRKEEAFLTARKQNNVYNCAKGRDVYDCTKAKDVYDCAEARGVYDSTNINQK